VIEAAETPKTLSVSSKPAKKAADRPAFDNYLKNTGDRLFQTFDKTTIPASVLRDSLEVYNQASTNLSAAVGRTRRRRSKIPAGAFTRPASTTKKILGGS